MNTQLLKEKAKELYGDKYDLSKVEYVNTKTKICIVCPKHGDKLVFPYNFLKGRGCYECGRKKVGEKLSMSTSLFIEKAALIHNGKYLYDKTDLDKRDEKGRVIITCPIHGDFKQIPTAHLRGQGCRKCKINVYDTESFIKESIKKFGNLYDYTLTKYKNSHTKVLIKCNKCGEIFKQTPNDHLCGKGCSFCNESKIEKHIKVLLEKNNIKYERHKHFDWLGLQHLDFYLPDFGLAIECQGRQHFEPVEAFGGEKEFIKTMHLDKLKFDKCSTNNIKIVYFTNLKKHCNFLGENLYKTDASIINLLKHERKLL